MTFYDRYNDMTNFGVSFTKTPEQDFGVYAKSYKNAADVIASDLLEGGQFREYYAYPIVFLYRHSFELHLKSYLFRIALIYYFNENKLIDIDELLSHNLLFLSKKLREYLKDLFPFPDLIDDIDVVISYAEEYSEIDCGSDCYRYPIKKDLTHSTKLNQTLNLRSIYESMQEFFKLLENLDGWLNTELDKSQISYEFREEFLSKTDWGDKEENDDKE